MASSAPFQFAGDSESEDDNFNPAPADISDDENDAHTTQRAAGKSDRRASSPAAEIDDDEDEDRPSKSASKRPRDDDEEDENGDEEDEEEAGVGNNDDDEDEEEEEDEDDDDVQHVSASLTELLWLLLLRTARQSPEPASLRCRSVTDNSYSVIAASGARTIALLSSISKLKSRTKTRPKTTRRTAKRSKTSSTMLTLTILPRAATLTMTGDIASSTAAAKSSPAWMQRNKPRFCGHGTANEHQLGAMGRWLSFQNGCCFPASTTPASGP